MIELVVGVLGAAIVVAVVMGIHVLGRRRGLGPAYMESRRTRT